MPLVNHYAQTHFSLLILHQCLRCNIPREYFVWVCTCVHVCVCEREREREKREREDSIMLWSSGKLQCLWIQWQFFVGFLHTLPGGQLVMDFIVV
jgi:hypothetical protein